jgi:hypothetical protein
MLLMFFPNYCFLFNLEHFCKKKYANPISFDQERPIRSFLDEKMGFVKKMVIFFGLLFITFDPVNRFSSFKNHYTPNFKGFILIYTLYTFSKFLVWDKTGFDL